MDIEPFLKAMTPEIYQRLRTAVETGKWPDGTALTDAQKEHSLQAVMLYQAKVLKSDEHMTVGEAGEIVTKSREQLKQELSGHTPIARFKQDDL